MNRSKEIFSSTLWDSCLTPNGLKWSCDHDFAIILHEELHLYIPSSNYLSHTFHSCWMKILPTKKGQDNSNTSPNKSTKISITSLTSWIESINEIRPITLKSVEWTPTGMGIPSRPLLTVLLNDGSVLLFSITTSKCSEYIFHSKYDKSVLFDLCGISIILELNNQNRKYQEPIDQISWSPIIYSHNSIKYIILFTISNTILQLWKIRNATPSTISSYSLYGIDIEVVHTFDLSSLNMNISGNLITSFFISAVNDRFDFDNNSNSCNNSIAINSLFISNSTGMIRRIDVNMSCYQKGNQSIIQYEFESIWIIRPFDSGIELFSECYINLSFNRFNHVLLASSDYDFCVIDFDTGKVWMPVDVQRNHKITGLFLLPSTVTTILSSLESNTIIESNHSLLLTMTMDGTLNIWKVILNNIENSTENESILFIGEKKISKKYIASCSMDPMSLCLYMAKIIPPEQKGSRLTQVNNNLIDTNTQIDVIPMVKIIIDILDSTLYQLSSSLECFTIYRQEFIVILKSICISSSSSLSLSKSTKKQFTPIVYYFYEMMKQFTVDIPDNWGEEFGLPPLSAIFPIEYDNDETENKMNDMDSSQQNMNINIKTNEFNLENKVMITEDITMISSSSSPIISKKNVKKSSTEKFNKSNNSSKTITTILPDPPFTGLVTPSGIVSLKKSSKKQPLETLNSSDSDTESDSNFSDSIDKYDILMSKIIPSNTVISTNSDKEEMNTPLTVQQIDKPKSNLMNIEDEIENSDNVKKLNQSTVLTSSSSSSKTKRVFRSESERKAARIEQKANKRGYTSKVLGYLLDMFQSHSQYRLNYTINSFYEAVCEVATVINAIQAKTMELEIFSNEEEMKEILLRLTTDEDPLNMKIKLWQVYRVVLFGVYARLVVDFPSIPEFHQILLEDVKNNLIIAEAIQSLRRLSHLINLDSSYVTKLTSIEQRSIHRRVEILELYHSSSTTKNILALSLATLMKKQLLSIDSISSSSIDDEICQVCLSINMISFDPSSPLISTCQNCGTMIERCLYTYELNNLDDSLPSVNMLDNQITKNVSNHYKLSNRIQICPLCKATGKNVEEERYKYSRQQYMSYIKVMENRMELDDNNNNGDNDNNNNRMANQTHRLYDWMIGSESTHICPYCSVTMEFL